jgi:Helix-loop-helix DNA-binding domain
MQCLIGGSTLPPLEDDDLPGPSGVAKRRRAEKNFNSWLAELGNEPEAETDGDATGAEEETGGAGGRRVGKRGRPMSDAALAKANRERARRERLNEYLDELSKLCDPSGKGIKGDRVSIVADAIRVVQQLRVENNQLKQLNKFLEERTGAMERARAQAMFQHAAAAQMQQQQRQAVQQQQQVIAQQQQALPMQHQQQQQLEKNVSSREEEITPYIEEETTTAGPSNSTLPAAPAGHVYIPIPIESLGAHVLSIKQEHMNMNGVNAQAMMASVPDSSLPPGAPPIAWLPAPDLTQDQKLRPPAA